jgi:hypothetical protein
MTSRLLVRFQLTVSEVENTLLELDSSNGPGPGVGVPPLILKSCDSSGFALPLCVLFNRSLATWSILPDGLKLSFVTPIFKNGRCNDISNYNDISSC